MAKYAFFCFPSHGHVNPTLALVQELVACGEQVIYYLTEEFRPAIEATGATFRTYESGISDFIRSGPPPFASTGKSRANAPTNPMPAMIIRETTKVLPQLLEMVPAEHFDYVVHDQMFLPARLLAQILNLPSIVLFPSYAANEHFSLGQLFTRYVSFSPEQMTSINEGLAHLCETYHQPRLDIQSLFLAVGGLKIVFLPRAFQLASETFDESFVFVGPSLQTQRYDNGNFPLGLQGKRPRLYISLGTVFNNQADFFNTCFDAFDQTEWQVVLSFGTRADRSALKEPPANFITAAHVPQLEVLPQTDVFISHGGMNSTMESFTFGVPLVVIPQMPEQQITATRVQELGMGIALDRESVTAEKLRAAVEQVSGDPTFRIRVQSMQEEIRKSGGYKRAVEAIMQYKPIS